MKIKITLLLLIQIFSKSTMSQGYSFKDPTAESKHKSNLNGYSGGTVSRMKVAGNQMRNSSIGGGGALPVSKYGSVSRGQNMQNASTVKYNGAQSNQGGNSQDALANLMRTNPQIKQLIVNAMNSGNQQQIQSVIKLVSSFLDSGAGGSSGMGGGSSLGGGASLGGASLGGAASAGNNVQHCSAPKYGGVMNAVKGINLGRIKAMDHSSDEKAVFVYYKKTDETNFTDYKLVFRFDKRGKQSFVYSNFVISRTIQGEPNFQNYLVTSNANLLSQIINESDFAPTNVIKCIDLKVMYNGGINNAMSTSAFGSGGAPQPAVNPGFNQNFGGNNNFNPARNQQPQQNFGGFGGQPQQNFGGFGGQQQQNFGGFGGQQQNFRPPQQNFGGFGGQQQQQNFGGFGGQPQQQNFGGFGGQPQQNFGYGGFQQGGNRAPFNGGFMNNNSQPQGGNTGGTFMINKN